MENHALYPSFSFLQNKECKQLPPTSSCRGQFLGWATGKLLSSFSLNFSLQLSKYSNLTQLLRRQFVPVNTCSQKIITANLLLIERAGQTACTPISLLVVNVDFVSKQKLTLWQIYIFSTSKLHFFKRNLQVQPTNYQFCPV